MTPVDLACAFLVLIPVALVVFAAAAHVARRNIAVNAPAPAEAEPADPEPQACGTRPYAAGVIVGTPAEQEEDQ